jgi:hypothetical protein
MALGILSNPHHEPDNDDDIAAAQALIEALVPRTSGIKQSEIPGHINLVRRLKTLLSPVDLPLEHLRCLAV